MTSSTRREFLQLAAAGAAGAVLGSPAKAAVRPRAASVIFINLVGGPSHLDTFDPKPDAPSDVRGPFRPIRTSVPGLHLSELFPNLAKRADKFALIRSMHHDAPPIHESGLQLNNTGRLFRDGPSWPNMGAVLGHLADQRCGDRRAWCVLPDETVETGINIGRGLDTGWLPADRVGPLAVRDHEAAGACTFAQSCLAAPGLVQAGHRFITINMFNTVFDTPSWDCHADRGSLRCDLGDYRDTVAPSFDTAFSELLVSLSESGLLDTTLVVATGEFGRTPRLNGNGGRDHWANCWTALVAGAGVNGGRVLGRSDAIGAEPADRPVSPQELVATVFHALGVPTGATIPGPAGSPEPVYPAKPILEL
jgi:uncharacterized protein (DUF1501 family)